MGICCVHVDCAGSVFGTARRPHHREVSAAHLQQFFEFRVEFRYGNVLAGAVAPLFLFRRITPRFLHAMTRARTTEFRQWLTRVAVAADNALPTLMRMVNVAFQPLYLRALRICERREICIKVIHAQTFARSQI